MKKLTTLSAVLASSSAFAADGLKIGGFVDGAYQSGGSTSAFFLHDAALYLGKTMGMGEVMIDIPVNNSGASNTFTLAGTKAQAFVHWKYDNGFNWRLGQFDSLYGYEANDSADRIFAVSSNVSGLFMPYTHTGLKVGYEMSDALGFDVLLANTANQGKRPTGGAPFDWGFKLSTKSDTFTAAVGGLFDKAALTGTKMGWLFNVMAETKTEMMTFAIDVALRKASAATADTFTKTEMGIMALVDFELAEDTTWGLRPEWTQTYAANEVATATDTRSKLIKIATGPAFKMSKDFTVRPEYTFSKASVTGAKAHHDFVLSAVHRF